MSLEETPAPRGRGRPGYLWWVDEPLVEEMRQLLNDRKVPTPESAAKAVAHRAYGGATWESKVDRLARSYRRRFSPAIPG